MGYANILVSVDLGEASPERVGLGAGLAQRFGATLTGAAARKVAPPVLVQDIYDAQAQADADEAAARELLQRAHETFADAAGEGIRTDWRPALAGPITHLVAQARSADLILVGRQDPQDADPDPLRVAPGPVLMEAGRPVLVVPPRTTRLAGARIVVAWKDSPEARRAVSGALGFIRGADRVFVVTTGEGARAEGAEEVAAHLARHGACVSAHLLKTAISDSDEILRFAQKQDADLIVMGGYGHSRLREWAFGGVTRDLLRHSPVCCLMSH